MAYCIVLVVFCIFAATVRGSPQECRESDIVDAWKALKNGTGQFKLVNATGELALDCLVGRPNGAPKKGSVKVVFEYKFNGKWVQTYWNFNVKGAFITSTLKNGKQRTTQKRVVRYAANNGACHVDWFLPGGYELWESTDSSEVDPCCQEIFSRYVKGKGFKEPQKAGCTRST